MAMPNKPWKLTEATKEKITSAIRAGAYIETAAAHAGISKQTLYTWLKAGARDIEKGLHTDESAFSRALETAISDAELRDIATVAQFANGYPVERVVTKVMVNVLGNEISRETVTERKIERAWQAAAWRLERRFPGKWGRRLEINHDGHESLVAEPVVVYLPDNGRGDVPKLLPFPGGGNGDKVTKGDSQGEVRGGNGKRAEG